VTGRLRSASPLLLAALLAGAGTTHFLAPEPYDAIVPSVLPAPRAWTYGSGVVELVVAAAVAVPRTRRLGATAAAALLVVVFPANVQMALDPGDVPRWLAVARLPLQVPLVLWALQVRRDAGRESDLPAG
jgi:uncharacterized membrane protein